MTSLHAEIISIGDELTSGQRLDTNSQWISQQLGAIGVRVMYHTTVADDLEANIDVLRQAIARADLIVTTGGLGPTADDLTRESLASAVGVKLYQDNTALAYIKRLFESRGREMPPKNIVQAQFPVGSTPVHNPEGTAPGIDLPISHNDSETRVFCLPGVPAEMKQMWSQTVEPAIIAMDPESKNIIRHFVIKTFGMGESDMERTLPDLIRRGRKPSVGITASYATITLRITAEGDTAEECKQQAADTITTIKECLGERIYAERECEIQDVVTEHLLELNRRVSVLESGTCGLVSHNLHSVNGKNSSLGHCELRTSLGDEYTPDALTDIAREFHDAHDAYYSIVVGDVIDATEQSVARIHVAIVSEQEIEIEEFRFTGHSDIRVPKAAKQAINCLRLQLLTSADHDEP
ncbi:MAG: competence/damage-inducible protein A [Planctomycetaceae bacterium]|nr:competence/damage-inducible protein A [Planctomycetaceae bacterium]|tara:strand:+ start:110 stop:1333 length:1224 start_codon:yes stop_codon:yes gene_type:complete